MSRSHKQPNFAANTTAKSEKGDKKTWHSRMRAKQRDQLASLNPSDAIEIISVCANEVSNTYDMAKDGRHYWSDDARIAHAKEKASKDINPQAKVDRLLAKQMSK
jgi:hypothetical protein